MTYDDIFHIVQLSLKHANVGCDSHLFFIITLLSPLYFVSPPQVHACLEMVFLLFFAVDAIFQLLWLRPRTFFTNKRSLIKVVILAVLFTDAFVVVCRGVVHVRVLRCLRPYFFTDCYITSGVRRSVEAGRGRLGTPFSQWLHVVFEVK